MKKQITKNATALLLTLVMMLSIFPMTAIANEAGSGTEMSEIISVYEPGPSSLSELDVEADESELVVEITDDNIPTRASHRTSISDLEGGIELVADSREIGIEPSDINSANDIVPAFGDFYFSINGFLTQPQAWSYLVFDVFPGEILHLQLDTPSVANIDYDLFLYRMVGNFMMSVASSELRTHINYDGSTLSETIGFMNFTPSIQTMVIVVESIVGFSASLPFTLHVAANTGFELFEVDALTQPRIFALGSDTTRIGVIDTRADNDWFRITVPENRDFDTIHISLDDASVNSGHVAELYRILNGQAHRVPITDGEAPATTGNHIIRVHNNNMPLMGVAYQLTVTTSQQPVEPFEPSISLYTTFNVIEPGQGFEVYGFVDIDAASTVAISLQHQSGTQFTLNPSVVAVNNSGRFTFGWLAFNETAGLGIYTFSVSLRNGQGVEVATASTQVELIAPAPPPPPPPARPARVTNISFASPAFRITYNGATHYRVNGNTDVTVTGRAVDASGNPVANAQLTLTFRSFESGDRIRTVETNADGWFTGTVRTALSAGNDRATVGGPATWFVHTFETIHFLVYCDISDRPLQNTSFLHSRLFIFANMMQA